MSHGRNSTKQPQDISSSVLAHLSGEKQQQEYVGPMAEAGSPPASRYVTHQVREGEQSPENGSGRPERQGGGSQDSVGRLAGEAPGRVRAGSQENRGTSKYPLVRRIPTIQILVLSSPSTTTAVRLLFWFAVLCFW